MAKPNFSFQKRQKELARQKKKEEKKLRKQEKSTSVPEDSQDDAPGGLQEEPTPAGAEQERA